MFRRTPVHAVVNYCDWAAWYYATGEDELGDEMVRCGAWLLDRIARTGI